MIAAALERGFEVLVLTNAMRPMRRFEAALAALPRERLTMRVSLDHHSPAVHEAERGAGTWAKALDGLRWLEANGFRTAVAGRQLPGESLEQARAGYAGLFAQRGLRRRGRPRPLPGDGRRRRRPRDQRPPAGTSSTSRPRR